ncbi:MULTISPECIES: fimbrial protein [Pseudomonas]|uniref:Fimbrial protein n=1 Tax=Pseudomonas putida S13.1.2 TaxID=1384061 RepID=A0AAU8RZ67_PSEPU|nr:MULTISPECIES: fimbrial protein [Pseudomonas]AJQ48457.1 fimbrial protein [Pseudomonas putida S13.1.2]
MKKTLMALALGLASSTAFADERGQILFKGNINGGTTCPIEIVVPGAGPIGAVDLENYSVKYFAANATTPDVAFALRVDADDATCTIPTGYTTKVTFDSLNGDAGPGNQYYAIRDSSRGLAVELKDDAYASIPPRTESKEYPVASTGVTDVRFYASYVRLGTAGSVTEGPANADVNFSITLP